MIIRIVLFLLLFAYTPLQGQENRFAKIDKIVDGDTVGLEDKSRVRFIGIDTPERFPGDKFFRTVKKTGAKNWQIVRLGDLAKDKLVEYIDLCGREVYLEFDEEKIDKYERTLAYIFVPYNAQIGPLPKSMVKNISGRNWVMLNALMIFDGYAITYPIPPNKKYKRLFDRLENQAKNKRRGLWAEELFWKL